LQYSLEIVIWAYKSHNGLAMDADADNTHPILRKIVWQNI